VVTLRAVDRGLKTKLSSFETRVEFSSGLEGRASQHFTWCEVLSIGIGEHGVVIQILSMAYKGVIISTGTIESL
jgi:hypothetical protein